MPRSSGAQRVGGGGALEESRTEILALDAAALRFIERDGGLRLGKRLLDAALSGLYAGDDEERRGLARDGAGAPPKRQGGLQIGQRAGEVAHDFADGCAVVQR